MIVLDFQVTIRSASTNPRRFVIGQSMPAASNAVNYEMMDNRRMLHGQEKTGGQSSTAGRKRLVRRNRGAAGFAQFRGHAKIPQPAYVWTWWKGFFILPLTRLAI
jgi:hypothetical protein